MARQAKCGFDFGVSNGEPILLFFCDGKASGYFSANLYIKNANNFGIFVCIIYVHGYMRIFQLVTAAAVLLLVCWRLIGVSYFRSFLLGVEV